MDSDGGNVDNEGGAGDGGVGGDTRAMLVDAGLSAWAGSASPAAKRRCLTVPKISKRKPENSSVEPPGTKEAAAAATEDEPRKRQYVACTQFICQQTPYFDVSLITTQQACPSDRSFADRLIDSK
jgi:hypothetical protein